MASGRLKSDSPTPRRRPLGHGGNKYFQLILFSTWDHVLGPRIIRVWGESYRKKDDTASTLSCEDDLIRAVATYSIDVTGETEGNDSIVEKFFVLHRRSVVVSAFLIHIANPAIPKDIKTFSLSFLLPYSELSEWLARRTFMENACRRIITRNLMIGLKEASAKKQQNWKSADMYTNALDDFECSYGNDNLSSFVKLAHHLRRYSVAHPLQDKTYFRGGLKMASGKDNHLDFIKKAVSAHFAGYGRTLVVGSDTAEVDKMIRTLALFSPPNECQMSLPVPKDRDIQYCSDLYLQGLVVPELKTLELPVKYKDIYQCSLSTNVNPPCVVLMDVKKVFQWPSLALYCKLMGTDALTSSNGGSSRQDKDLSPPPDSNVKLEVFFSEVRQSAPMIDTLFMEMKELPPSDNLCQTYIAHFHRLLQRKAVIMAKFLLDNLQPSKCIPLVYDVCIHRSNATIIKVLSEELLASLQQMLATHDEQDLLIIECALGRLDPALMRTYIPAAAAIERRRSRVMNELGVL